MFANAPGCGAVVSAADINERIRDLARRSPLAEDERWELARLWSEWQTARDAEDPDAEADGLDGRA
ncbi:hypothetical protein [Streptomyces sp. NBC_01190]|uniref:hypothetical protein n=1 Tax=Streptomyces sp. NBC_01190 TaxID=2903767 RepID=UPI00386BB56F|nr:hypothetical protein OG519_23955 [Streptomyces sp. NBC_01190]